ncbi:cobalt ABC transporter [Leptolyngbya sp. 'hensonii']|uniref:ABC transporter ATP-binding protein n=1 Tax=Leptolyngbya sp. 'hensonii' TaxID=1922337 RepID=UPI00094F91A1|nr:ATP-binding cassette domain-containing protein [Leptolyngbya sp. 'hensonii']OLP19001.1 cobalt ABC transporter [Leptolyngbya sp. 'hensonii']
MEMAQIRLEAVDLAFSALSKAPNPKKESGSDQGSALLLQGISCQIFRGDRIAIVGPSGSGKTVLLKLLNRLIDPTRGQIYLEGQKFQRIPVIQLRQQILLVPQESRLLDMTVREALLYPLKLRHLTTPEMGDRLGQWTEQLQIPTDWLDKTELQLSVGQRQWVAIARALVAQPPVLLLDEPTSALDAGKTVRLLEVLSRLTANAPSTILMVNHQLEVAEQFADRVFHLNHGFLAQDALVRDISWSKLRDAIVQAETSAAQDWE